MRGYLRWGPLRRLIAPLLFAVVAGAGCGSTAPGASTRSAAWATGIPRDLVLEARPVGRSPRFRPPVAGAVTGRCLSALGKRIGVHVEVFASNRVVIVPAGIGTRPPRTFFAGRITRAGCYGDLVTIDPTGLVLVRLGSHLLISALFRAWGQPLTERRVASFPAPSGTRVAVFVDGRAWRGAPGSVPLSRHAEIVLEVGPYVPPHASYTFPADA